MKDRCHLVYAVAPDGVNAREANDLLNRYIEDRSRGMVAFHDHFTTRPHGGLAVFHVQNEEELARLSEPGPLEGWTLNVHPLIFSLTAVGFAAQTELTLEGYRGTTLEQLRAAEPRDKRYWWQKREK